MKTRMILVLFALAAIQLTASNRNAIDYYEAGDMTKAKTLLLATTNPDATDYFHLGQIFLKEKDVTKAEEYFNKGLQADPANLYNKVGLAAVNYSKDPKAIAKELKSISGNKLYKKDPAMQVAIAEVFLRNNNPTLGQSYLARAKKADRKSSLPYVLEGNLFMEQGKGNEAAGMFEQAVYFDPNSKVALVKLAQIYLNTRRQIAFDYLDRATTVDPNYEYGWRTQADLRREAGFYPEAKQAFEKYMGLARLIPEDYQIYGQILYFNNDYKEALAALAKAPINTVTNRLKMYSMFDQKNFEEALPLAETLLKNAPKEELIIKDYTNMVAMLNDKKDYLRAASYLEEAYQLDTTRVAMLTDIARAYENGKDYANASKFYEKLISEKPENLYNLGVMYYSAGNDAETTPDADTRRAYLVQASDVFGRLAELFPTSHVGLLYQARTQSAMDPETTEGLAKPFYEDLLPILLETPEERRTEILEVYQYLGIYYLKADDYKMSREYWVKVQELDPENAIAKQVITSIDSVRKR